MAYAGLGQPSHMIEQKEREGIIVTVSVGAVATGITGKVTNDLRAISATSNYVPFDLVVINNNSSQLIRAWVNGLDDSRPVIFATGSRRFELLDGITSVDIENLGTASTASGDITIDCVKTGINEDRKLYKQEKNSSELMKGIASSLKDLINTEVNVSIMRRFQLKRSRG